MPNITKIKFLEILKTKYGEHRKLSKSLSLFDLEDTQLRLYLRYSKKHKENRTFYGLRHEDLRKLEGKNKV